MWTERVTIRDALVGMKRQVCPCPGISLLIDTGGGPLDPSKAWRFTGNGIAGMDAIVRWKVVWEMRPILDAHATIAAALTHDASSGAAHDPPPCATA